LRGVTSEKTWRPDSVLMLISSILILIAVANLAPALAEKLSEKLNWKLGDWPKIGGIIIIHAGVLVMLGIFIRHHELSWTDFFGLYSPHAGSAMCRGIGLGLLVVPVLLAINWGAAYLLRNLNHPSPEQDVVILVKGNQNVFLRGGLAFAALVSAPLVEESIFRGVLYPAIKQHAHRLIALLFTSLLFAAIHSNLMTFIPLTIFAILLAILYDRTRVLMACVLAHLTFNAVNFAMLLNENRIELFLRHLRERI
jgi:membrane protease YdiL (CAAX protease family)